MLTQLQLEGPELEPLLDRVRTELGTHARIVHAEKIRSGGVAGFFAHQRFELTVEVDTSLPRPAPPGPGDAVPSAPASAPARVTEELPAPVPVPAGGMAAIAGLDAAPHDEPGVLTTPARRGSGPAGPAAHAAHAYAAQSAPVVANSPAARLLSPTPPPPPPAGPAVGTDLPVDAPAVFAPYAAFAALVDEPAPHGATAGEPAAAPAPAVSVLELADRVSAEEQDAVVSTESSSFAALLSRLHEDIGAGLDGAAADASEDVAVDLDAPGALDAPAVLDVPPVPDVPAVLDVPAQRAASDPRAVAVRPGTEATAGASADLAGPAAELARLGLPAHLRPSGAGERLLTALRASLTRLPTAPPAMNRPGAVLALVGPLPLAVHVAREIAEELGLPAATAVAVATAGAAPPGVSGRQVLHAAAEAAQRRSTWRRRSNLTVVAVEAPLTATGAADARAFLAALSPSATWGVVEATRKAQDVGSWTRALGGVHALALTDLEETSDPAAVLELGIPISRLGSRPATPRAWATLLTGRLAA